MDRDYFVDSGSGPETVGVMTSTVSGVPKGFEGFQAIGVGFPLFDFEGLVVGELQGYVESKGFGRDGGGKDFIVDADQEAVAHAGMDRDGEFVAGPIPVLPGDRDTGGFKVGAGFSFGDKETAGVDGDLAGVDDLEDEMGESAVGGLMAHEDFGVKAFIQSGDDGVVDGESEREGGDDFAVADRGGEVFQGG